MHSVIWPSIFLLTSCSPVSTYTTIEGVPPANLTIPSPCQAGADCSAMALNSVRVSAPPQQAPIPAGSRRRKGSSRRRRSGKGSRRRKVSRRRRRRRTKSAPGPAPAGRRRRRTKGARGRRRRRTKDVPGPMPRPLPDAPESDVPPIDLSPPIDMPPESPVPTPQPRTPAPTPAPRPPPPPAAPAPAKCSSSTGKRYKCSSSVWDGSVTRFAGGSSFCDCSRSSNCAFVCAGGKPNGEGQCGKAACQEGIYTFCADNSWTITVKKEESAGKDYHAFAYLVWKNVPPAVEFSFSFKAIGHNTVYTKLFVLGDGRTIYGLLPPKSPGGPSNFCFMPLIEAGTNTACIGNSRVNDNTWYRVDLIMTVPGMAAKEAGGYTADRIAVRINGKPVNKGKSEADLGNATSTLINHMPKFGVYHSGNPETYKFVIRDMCVGNL